jgi:hypothetical protein
MVGMVVDVADESVVVVVIATATPTVVVTFSGPTPGTGGGIFVGAWPTAAVGAMTETAAVGVTLGETTPRTDAMPISRSFSSAAIALFLARISATKAEKKSEPEYKARLGLTAFSFR